MLIHTADPENTLVEKLIMQIHSFSCLINSDSLSTETGAHMSMHCLFPM